MSTRVILQDNLWFRGRPALSNYFLGGLKMVAVKPKLGFTDSFDVRAKTRELRWLERFTGRDGAGVVIAQQWHKPGNLIDRTLRDTWLSVFESVAPAGKWCIFYDPILATTQRGLVAVGEPVDLGRPNIFRLWKRDLKYLAPYFAHPQYWRIDGRPVLYVWASFALRGLDRAFSHARQRRSLYLLADVLGTDVRPKYADGITGFTAAIPGLERSRHRLPDLMMTFRQHYASASVSGLDFIPAGSCQYDDVVFLTARDLGVDPLQILAASRREVEEFLSLAAAFAQPIEDTRYVFWGTLNNWAEGTTVLPTRTKGPLFRTNRIGHYRFAHLQAIRNVLFS